MPVLGYCGGADMAADMLVSGLLSISPNSTAADAAVVAVVAAAADAAAPMTAAADAAESCGLLI